MTRLAKMLFGLASPMALVPVALAAHTHVPAPSTWTLNVKETDFAGGPVIKSDIDHVLVDSEKQLHWSDVTVDGNGNTSKTSWNGPEDGSLHPIQGLPGAQASWDSATDTEHSVFADGTVYDAVLTLSADKKKMTFAQTVSGKDGNVFHQSLVYDRIK